MKKYSIIYCITFLKFVKHFFAVISTSEKFAMQNENFRFLEFRTNHTPSSEIVSSIIFVIFIVRRFFRAESSCRETTAPSVS